MISISNKVFDLSIDSSHSHLFVIKRSQFVDKTSGPFAMASEVETIINLEDEKYPFGDFRCRGNDKNSPISVDDYNGEFIATPSVTFIDLDNYADDSGGGDVVFLEEWKGKVPVKGFREKSRGQLKSIPFSDLTVIEIGESSSSCSSHTTPIPRKHPPHPPPTSFCAICMEPKLVSESIGMSRCSHMFCTDCIGLYISAKIQDNVTSICCPDPECKVGFLEPEMCHPILPPEVFERWCSTLCESFLFNSSGFYCPFKDCSAPLLNEDDGSSNLEVITQSECPYCWRLFCVQCKVPWHVGFTCEEYQKLGVDERGQEDMLLMNMAKNKKWQRCPKCKIFVERTEGCMFMKCRCGYTFCYGCGTEMTTDHYCHKCRR